MSPDVTIYCETKKAAIEARKQLREQGMDACYGKAKYWRGYNVGGYKEVKT